MTEDNNQEKEVDRQLEECCKIRDEYLAGWQRAKADFLNYQKDERERIKDVLDFAKMAWVFDLLSIYDNLERAVKFVPKDQEITDWALGVIQIKNQFQGFLKEQGIEEIDSLGKRFDPLYHEAVIQEEKEGPQPETIIEVLEKGYLLNGKVLRPSKVKVSK
jgi:molecular chaperone GrpE